MSDAAEPKETREFEGTLALFLMILLGTGLSQLLKGWALSDAKAFVLSWMIAFVVGYWLPPRPADGFLRWLLKSSIVIAFVYMIVFLVPAWLDGSMPLLYYGVPIVTFIIFFIFVRRSSFFSSWRRA